MRVPTKLKSISYILVTTLILLLSSVIWLLITTRSANSDLKLVDEIQTNFLERNSLRDRYFLYHEEFIQIQWEKSKQLSDSLLRQAGLQLRDKESQENIEALVRNIDDSAAIFKRIVATANALKSAGGNREILEELNKRLSSQLLLKETLIRDTTFALKNSALKSVQQRYWQLTVTILLLAASLSIGIISWNILLKQQVKSKTIHLENEIAERLLAEEALSASETHFRSYYELGLIGMAITTRDKGWVQSNDFLCSMFGYSREELFDRTLAEMTHPDDIAADKEKLQKVLRGEIDGYTLDQRFIHKNGQIIHTALSVKCVRRLDGAPDYFVVMVQDITERKRYEQKLRDKNTELDRFAYTVSHDLKSPLITIQAYAGMIEKDMETGKYERARDDMKRIEGAANKMTALLNDLLELSRAGRMMSEPSAIDMNLLVKECIAQLAGVIGRSQVEVVVQPDLPSVHGDHKRIAQVVQNLIENAIKYMGDQAGPRIEIGTRQEGKECVFFISDNGAGVDPRHHEKVFGLFNKLDTESDGTGIGLALVKRIIEAHGGRVWVESEGVGTGSRFCFTLGSKEEVHSC